VLAMTNATSDVVATQSSGVAQPSREPTNLGDILERVLDKGLIIAGDIKVNLLDIELLTIKLRLMVVSVETARQLGIDWWEHDSWLNSNQRELEEENDRLRQQLAARDERSVGGRKARREVESSAEVIDETPATSRKR